MGFGATRSEDLSDAGPVLGAPNMEEPAPAPAFPPKPPPAATPKSEEFEFMARALDRISAKIKGDEKFRKLSERFVERYLVIAKRLFAEGADDKLAVELSDTRTGRAYLLIADALGRL